MPSGGPPTNEPRPTTLRAGLKPRRRRAGSLAPPCRRQSKTRGRPWRHERRRAPSSIAGKARARRQPKRRRRRPAVWQGFGGRLEGLQARLAEEATRGISRAARRAGGRPLSDGLEVEAGFRVAVEAALGEAMRGYVIGREAALGLDGQRGVLVLEGAEGREVRRGAAWRDRDAEAEAAAEAAAGCGGGRLAEVIRVDPVGAAGRLLARSVWVPDLSAALAIQPKLPAGWLAVTLGGAVVTSFGVVEHGPRRVAARAAGRGRAFGRGSCAS